LDIRILMLAAGGGRRFGADKLSAPLPDGTPVGLASARALRLASADVLAVVRDAAEGIAPRLAAEGVPIVPCPQAAAGMGHSLACGVRASADADGWLVALADMPFIQPASVVAVLDALRRGADIAAPTRDGRRGHPVGFSARWREPLSSLVGDRGARDLLAAESDRIVSIPCNDPGIFRDVDVPADLHLPGAQRLPSGPR
jgi:molybdenum cofactor cytidylyltransferase